MRTRKRSDNINNGSFVRAINKDRAVSDKKNNQAEELNLCKILGNKNRKTKVRTSIEFEEKYYPERY